ncbi:MAG: hypothetical protein RhofKO_28990 [Rhodothermales bacterium]
MIELRHLIKRYNQRTVVQVPHLVVHPGEVVGLLGNNGAGKTTLLRLLLDQIQRMKAWRPSMACGRANIGVETPRGVLPG